MYKSVLMMILPLHTLNFPYVFIYKFQFINTLHGRKKYEGNPQLVPWPWPRQCVTDLCGVGGNRKEGWATLFPWLPIPDKQASSFWSGSSLGRNQAHKGPAPSFETQKVTITVLLMQQAWIRRGVIPLCCQWSRQTCCQHCP